jgi:lipopolysaccharide/colanic/teichoic acid biosynthesis glycosyltransferase
MPVPLPSPATARFARLAQEGEISLFLANLAANRPAVPPGGNRSLVYQLVKRGLDILGALVALILLSPLLVTVWALLMWQTRGHAIFSQERVGECGRRFLLFKFRTMVMNAERAQVLIKNEHKDGPIFKNQQDPRVTRLGRWLRKHSIDEMPQLVNVLLGQMSLVGPRPPVEKEVAIYEPWQRERLMVKPGLTCLWQVSGRSRIGFREWMRMDIWYVRNQSLAVDLWLLWRTPMKVITGHGAY